MDGESVDGAVESCSRVMSASGEAEMDAMSE